MSMSAYCIFDIREIVDREKMAKYREGVAPTVERFGGRYLALGGPFDVVEGDWRPVFPVIIEFPSLEEAHRWYRSEEYAALLDLRLQGSRGTAVFIEGK
jgi:uncharacterized protein (DUF1330 family)